MGAIVIVCGTMARFGERRGSEGESTVCACEANCMQIHQCVGGRAGCSSGRWRYRRYGGTRRCHHARGLHVAMARI